VWGEAYTEKEENIVEHIWRKKKALAMWSCEAYLEKKESTSTVELWKWQ